MDLVALVKPSHGIDPGHMVIGQESSDGVRYFGFRFDPEDLPAEFRPAERWQEYLLSNTVNGFISDEVDFVRGLRLAGAHTFLEKRAPYETQLETVLPSAEKWKSFATYSFNPDDFHSNASPCYNCVTWAIEVGNKVVPGFLTPVRHGRMKLILRQLRVEDAQTGDDDE